MVNDLKLPLVLKSSNELSEQIINQQKSAKLSGALLCTSLRESVLAGNYKIRDFFGDLMSGMVVGLVAIPLGMALGIATGVNPEYGLYTVIVAGFLTALLGGSRFQVSGPTAAFVVILEPIVADHGLGGLLTAGMLSGIIVLIMGICGMGKLIHYMPDTVKYGFTAGIAVTIGAQQIKDLIGVSLPKNCTHFTDIIIGICKVAGDVSVKALLVSIPTLAAIIVFPQH